MQKQIKVLHTEWSDGWGGQEIRIINEMLAVREQEIRVCLACRENAIIKQKALENNIKVFILPFRGNTDFKTLFTLKNIIKEHDIDIVNTHSGKDTWVGGLAAKFAGAKFIRTRHLSNPINPSRLNFINGLADYIFTTGESVRTNMIKHNRIKADKIKSIPTGVDADIFNPEKYDKEKCRKIFNLKDDEIIIGIVAVLRQFKRHDLFLQMAKQLIKKYPDKKLKFLIAGDGPQKENIIKIIKKLNLTARVKLIGHISKVPQFLSAIDIFVLSSDSKEGVPQSVMQALLMNKKVVATDSGSTSDLYFNNNFQLVETNNPDELVNGVEFFLQSEFNKYNREYIVQNFSKLEMAKQITSIYQELEN